MIKKLGNQGFAITGILYTIFVLFLLILVSILANLSTKKNLLETTISDLEESYSATKLISPTEASPINIANSSSYETLYDGKYIFKLNQQQDDGTVVSVSTNCVAYLKRGTEIKVTDNVINVTLIPQDCNDYKVNSIDIIGIYSND